MEGEQLLSLISKDFELRGNGRWWHSIEHDSLVVDSDRGMWFWNSKGLKGTAYNWLTEIKGLSHNQAKDYLKQLPAYTDTFIHRVFNGQEVVVYPKLIDVFYQEALTNPEAWCSYWYKRGLTDETVSRFKLGYHNGWHMIPIYMDGVFRNFQMRRDEPHKMIQSYYKDVGRLLFNSDILRYTSEIFITEGPTDCLRLLQEGIPAISHNAGSEGWNKDWFKYFIHQKSVYVVYDNDTAGVTGGKIVARNLGLYKTKVYTFPGFGPKYDVCDFFNDGHTKEEFLELVKGKAKFAFEEGV